MVEDSEEGAWYHMDDYNALSTINQRLRKALINIAEESTDASAVDHALEALDLS